MNITKLKPFLIKTSKSRNQLLSKQAEAILDQMTANQAQDQVVAPEVQDTGTDTVDAVKKKDQVDGLLLPAFPDLCLPDGEDSTFGKQASAYIGDVIVKDLPKEVQADILKLIPDANPNAKVVQYGLVVDELLPKVDPHNFEAAEEHLKKELVSKGKKVMGDKFQDKIKTKYILLLNDRITDGHHFLAHAKSIGITCSLRVLDLTSLRFQTKKASLLSQLKIRK